MAEGFSSFIDSGGLLNNPQLLRARIAQDGYLFIRSLAPRESLLALRRAILEICADAGWVTRDELMLGLWSGAGPFTEGEPEYQAVYKRILNHPLFLAFADQRELTGTIG